ncbi:MAG: PilZ domain-containing protein [Acidimicrobiia bacterium]|nr:PilZ domain-containing protein [Acidimicrobiia bacterium]
MPKFDQTAARQDEGSKVLVKWTDTEGNAYTEKTETRDISETGISFYLKTPIWLDTHLTLTIGLSALFGRLHTITAKVVRVQTDAAGRQLVGARFDE